MSAKGPWETRVSHNPKATNACLYKYLSINLLKTELSKLDFFFFKYNFLKSQGFSHVVQLVTAVFKTHLNSNFKRLVSVFLLLYGRHTAAVKSPPLQEIARVWWSFLYIPLHFPLIRVEGVAPWLRLSKKVHHLGVRTIPEEGEVVKANAASVDFRL